MEEDKIITKLKTIYEKITPNNFNLIKEKIKEKESEKNMKKTKKGLLILIPSLAVIILTLFITANNTKNYTKVALDVNPSIELKLDKNEKIKEATSNNKEGKEVLKDINLENVDLNTGLYAIIGSMLKNGYITEIKNSILVTVENEDTKKGEKIQKELETEINEIMKNYNIEASILTQTISKNSDLENKAKEYGITLGKAELIEEIIKTNNLYTFKELANLSIQELNLLTTRTNTTLENINKVGNPSQKEYITKEEVKNIIQKDLNTNNIQNLEIEFDYEKGIMIYEVEFYLNNKEYDYEINAKTGEIIEKTKEYEEDTPVIDSKGKITKEEALNIALEHSKLQKEEIKNIQVEYDYDDGLYVYEIEFEKNNLEYSYEINVITGQIIEYEIDD